MRIAILTNNRPNYSLVLAQSLGRMFERIGVAYKLFYDGLAMLSQPIMGRLLSRTTYRSLFKQLSFYWELRDYDAIIVVMTIPEAFLKTVFIERVRIFLPKTPLVQCSNRYVVNSGEGIWLRRLKEGMPGNPNQAAQRGGNYGPERYDWYLCSSLVSSRSLRKEAHPVSAVGINFEHSDLFPDQGDRFVALLDFEREGYERERAIQIQALEETNTPYTILKGHYPLPEIREIYRKSSLYFLASPESFGLPICELQACGSYILTPYPDWPSAHWLKDDLTVEGAGTLSPNFIVYDNDKQKLIQAIHKLKQVYDSSEVVKTFQYVQPQFCYGNLDELQRFVALVQSGRIHSKLHKQHIGLTG